MLINDAIAQKKLPGAVVVVGHDGKVRVPSGLWEPQTGW